MRFSTPAGNLACTTLAMNIVVVVLVLLAAVHPVDSLTCAFTKSDGGMITDETCMGKYCMKTIVSGSMASYACTASGMGATCPNLSEGNLGFCSCDSGDFCAGGGANSVMGSKIVILVSAITVFMKICV